MNTDLVAGISDSATDGLNLVFTTPAGKDYLQKEHGVPLEIVENLRHFGFSSICNTLAAIKAAKQLDLSSDDVVITVATDGSELYESEKELLLQTQYGDGFTSLNAAEIFEEHLLSADTQHIEELDEMGRNRIFNLGYYTWVEQQGVSIEDFDARRSQEFWNALHQMTPKWDEMIAEFNAQTGVTV